MAGNAESADSSQLSGAVIPALIRVLQFLFQLARFRFERTHESVIPAQAGIQFTGFQRFVGVKTGSPPARG